MIYEKHDSTFRCKYLAGGNVGRRRRWSEEGRGEVLVHLPRPQQGYKRHGAIYRGERLRPEVPVPPRVIVGLYANRSGPNAVIHHMDMRKQGPQLETCTGFIFGTSKF